MQWWPGHKPLLELATGSRPPSLAAVAFSGEVWLSQSMGLGEFLLQIGLFLTSPSPFSAGPLLDCFLASALASIPWAMVSFPIEFPMIKNVFLVSCE